MIAGEFQNAIGAGDRCGGTHISGTRSNIHGPRGAFLGRSGAPPSPRALDARTGFPLQISVRATHPERHRGMTPFTQLVVMRLSLGAEQVRDGYRNPGWR